MNLSSITARAVVFLGSVAGLGYALSASAHTLPDCLSNRSLMPVSVQLEISRSRCFFDWIDSTSNTDLQNLRNSPLTEAVRNRLSLYKATNAPVRFDIGWAELFISQDSVMLSEPGHADVPLVAATDYRVSPDGSKFIFTNNTTGADAPEWKIYDIGSRQVLADEPIRIRWNHITWDQSSEGLFYTRWPSQEVEERWRDLGERRYVPLAHHRVGTSTATDEIIFDSPETKTSMIFSAVQPARGNGLFVFRQFSTGVTTPMYLGQRSGTGTRAPYTWTQLQGADDWRNGASFVGRIGNEAIFRSASCGNSYCLYAVQLQPPFQRRSFIPYTPHLILSGAQLIGPYLLTTFIDSNLHMRIRTYSLQGQLINEIRPQQLGLPRRGTFSGFSGNRISNNTYFTFSSMDRPPVTLRYNLRSMRIERVAPTAPHPFERNPIQVTLKHYRSFDGTMVPIHVYSRRDVTANPKFALLFYYGALGANYLPSYSARFMAALELGGIVAVANVRGGGERGYNWYRVAGLDKSVTVKDIAWASRWLKREYPIENSRVIATGGSWGGLHTYLSLIDYANDFAGFISAVPVASLPYSFQSSLFGWLIPDDMFFRRDRNGEHIDFQAQIARATQWSALENVHRMTTIKPILTVATKNDERVGREPGPLMTAALIQKFGPSAPIYFIEAQTGGHSISRLLPEEMAFIGQLANITSLVPMADGRLNPSP